MSDAIATSSIKIAFIDKIDELYGKWVALMAMSQANFPKLATITASIANRAEFSKLPYQLLSEKNSRTSCSRLEQLPMVRVVGVILVNIAFIVKLTSSSRTRP
ncbi:hypothetical protein T05_992 [Trichinella murrelli]|uniref:Uncharacterized protein n=1 Tax=Trichinella murrelli TaxID=144512 RepID=A0A0V0TAC7_9BILA|nr:hypothetical protein T05_992 [Trichinella murrelli]